MKLHIESMEDHVEELELENIGYEKRYEQKELQCRDLVKRIEVVAQEKTKLMEELKLSEDTEKVLEKEIATLKKSSEEGKQ